MHVSPDSPIPAPGNAFEATIEDQLLAEIAIRLQLSPTDYDKAVQRYQTIGKFLEGHEELPAPILGIFPQGSMATGTTVAARDGDEFDIDLVVDLGSDPVWLSAAPAAILDFFHSLFRNSDRYRLMVSRKSRCSTLSYADGQHLDITPIHLRDQFGHGYVMHHRPEDRTYDQIGLRVASSPRQFADWFERMMPNEASFGRFYEQQSLTYNRTLLMEMRADVEPVPDQLPAYRKPRAKVSLQLLKRFRNLRYQERSERMPPSILLSKLIADNAGGGVKTYGLYEELQRLATVLLDRFLVAERGKTLISEVNPKDLAEQLTDRWPASVDEQNHFIADLMEFRAKLAALPQSTMAVKKTILTDLFGEHVSERATKAVSDALGSASKAGRLNFKSGGSASVVLGSQGARSGNFTPRKKDFYGV